MKPPHLTVVILVLAAALFLHLWAADALGVPERMATHFNAAGQADGWGDRTPAFLLLSMIGAGLGVGTTVLAFALPTSAMNLPWRARWAGQVDRLRDLARTFLLLIAVCQLVTFHLLAGMLTAVNRPEAAISGWFWLLPLVVSVASLGLATAWFLRRLAGGPR